jgi:tRNA A37 threonylcarbamoyladenosine dehydratase
MRPILSLRISGEFMEELEGHLFPGDNNEHGAVIAASLLTTSRGTRLLAHRLFLARDGVDYVPGQRGYRMLTATFVMDCALECAELGMAYLAVHCHRKGNRVAFSRDDLASHERGYPALLDILNGPPAGGLVFATEAVAGDVWFPDRSRYAIDELVVAGRPIRRMYPAPPPRPSVVDERFDRQARLLGDRGQETLGQQKVGVIGAGGAGSLIVEYLSRLGVGEITVVDPERIEPSNLSRVVGSARRNTRPWLTHRSLPAWIRARTKRLRTSKVAIARRMARRANPGGRFQTILADVTTTKAANKLVDCDFLVLAADSMQARLVFNALVHQYLIPGVQVGVKAQVNAGSGEIVDLFTVTRPVVPGMGCLWCNGLILPGRLQEEATSPRQRDRQRYVDEEDIVAPSVITLNAVASSMGADDFLMSVTGLLEAAPLEWVKTFPRTGVVATESPRRDLICRECSSLGRLGRGPTARLPLREGS